MGSSTGFSARGSHPSPFRVTIWPEANGVRQNYTAAFSGIGVIIYQSHQSGFSYRRIATKSKSLFHGSHSSLIVWKKPHMAEKILVRISPHFLLLFEPKQTIGMMRSLAPACAIFSGFQ